MIVRFYDRQDLENPLNGSSFESGESLIATLDTLTNRQPFFCELIGERGFNMLIGLGGVWSCVQHSPMDGDPPYLMALRRDDGEDGGDLEFLIENTATPVPYRFRLSREELNEVARHFVETGKPAPLVRWEEI